MPKLLKRQAVVKCAQCVGSAIGTRLELYRALWRQRLDLQWECNSHQRHGDEARFLNFWHEPMGTR